MEKVDRGELLRKRFRAIGGIPYQPSGKTIRKPYSYKGTEIVMAWDNGIGSRSDRDPVWTTTPDQKPKPALRLKRQMGTHALTKIANQAPKKLIRAYWTAEEILAEHKQQSQPLRPIPVK